ncbi:MAG: FtsX-like permease family protein [Bacteroidota bacterium]
MSEQFHPPRLALRFVSWFLKRELLEEVIGDLEEKYELLLEGNSKRQADWQYWLQVMNYLRPFAIRNDLITDLNPFFMFRSHWKIAWRSLLKQKQYALLNLAGMTVGLTCFLLLTMYIQYESSYDQQHAKSDRIYRVVQRQEGNMFQGTDMFALSPSVMVPKLLEDFPEVETGTTISFSNTLFSHEQEAQYENGLYADSAFFDVFDYTLIHGSIAKALGDPNALVLTASMAEKYFGRSNPVGKTLQVENEKLMTVQAVIADPPNNQHFSFDFITRLENYGYYEQDLTRWKWVSNNYRAYIVLPPDYDYQVLTQKMEVLNDIARPFYSDYSFAPEYFLQPLEDIHLHSHLNMELQSNGDILRIYLAGGIAIVILLLALINYVNLTTARATQRVREVGVRKVLGAAQRQVVGQFFVESVIVVGISLLLAGTFAIFLLPAFNELLGLQIGWQWLGSAQLFFGALGVLLLLILVSGLYPAIISALAQPVDAIRGARFTGDGKRKWLGQALVIGQFAAAIILALGSIIIYQQLQYIQEKNLGYERDHIVHIPYIDQDVLTNGETFREQILQHPGIEKLAFGSQVPLESENQGIADEWEGRPDGAELPIYRNYIDYHFLDLFEIELVNGRNFSPDFPTDRDEAYILNEAAVKALGWTNENAVGKTFEEGKIVGVVADFHFQPFNLAIEPMFMRPRSQYTARYGNIIAKIRGDQQSEAIAHIAATMQEVLPLIPYDLRFLDESYNQLYITETRFGEAFTLFTGLALFIACLGLLGLVTHQVLHRTKEIGIRKVLGASVPSLVALLSSAFLRQVFLASLIAAPIAWWAMQRWLQNFAYHIEIKPWVFILVGGVTLLIAFLTIGTQSIRAALANPVEALKIE